jgi:large repetitive protein
VVSGLTPAAFTATATGTGTPSTLAITTQPPSSVTVGATLSPAPVVQVRDAAGHNVAVAGVEITVGVSSGKGQVSGTTTVATDGNGQAQFSDLRITGASGSHKLIFAADGYRSVTSNKIEVEKASTATTITNQSSPSSNPGESVTVEFTVTSPVGTPSGDVEVTASGGEEKCTAPVAQGSCDIVLNTPGDRILTATYKGNDVFSSSSSAGVLHQVTQPVNQPPVAVADEYSTQFGQVLEVPAPGVLANDTDPEGGSLTAQLVDSPAQGLVTLNSNGSFTYFPGGVSGTVDTFTYDVSDGASTARTTVTITVQ